MYVHVSVSALSVPPDMTRDLVVIAEEVAARVRTSLGGPDVLAAGDSLVAAVPRGSSPPRSSIAGVRIVAHRGGGFRWTPLSLPDAPTTALLERALAAANRDSALFITPDAFRSDSVILTLDYRYGVESHAGAVHARAYGPASLVAFSLRATPDDQVDFMAPIAFSRFDEPPSTGTPATVNLQFVVDTTGRADASTIRDVWVSDKPRPTGALGRSYSEFVQTATNAVTRATFHPAVIGGCKMPHLVEVPFTFRVTR